MTNYNTVNVNFESVNGSSSPEGSLNHAARSYNVNALQKPWIKLAYISSFIICSSEFVRRAGNDSLSKNESIKTL
jgi:hypothetical protein